jgi:hypothetical protein
MNKVTVSPRAAEERVRRAVAREGTSLRKGRGNADLGEYYGIDMHNNTVAWAQQTLPQLVLDLGVLKPWETLAADTGDVSD